MARFVKGDIVVVPFPFSNLTQSKRRPALVIANLHGNDIILCQITSQNVSDTYSISLTDNDLQAGSLKKASNIRPNRIFTADNRIILYKIGGIKKTKMEEVINTLIMIVQS